MSKAGKKILSGARETLAIARGDVEAISKIKVTPSCGCVFCDIGLPLVDGYHTGRGDARVACRIGTRS